ncbi:MAG: hypothetical protein ABIQ39_05830, partial [Ilumatobacteraceae bacterium]
LRAEQLAAPDLIADAMGVNVAALVAVITALNTQIDGLESKLADRFEQHPDAKSIDAGEVDVVISIETDAARVG